MRMSGKLVGMKFAAGAEVALLDMFGTFPVIVERDPANKFDRNAVRVSIPFDKMPPAALERVKAESKTPPSDPFFLGHIARDDAAEIAPEMDARPYANAALDANGRQPIVLIDWEG